MNDQEALAKLRGFLVDENQGIIDYADFLTAIRNDPFKVRTQAYIQRILGQERKHAEDIQVLIRLYEQKIAQRRR